MWLIFHPHFISMTNCDFEYILMLVSNLNWLFSEFSLYYLIFPLASFLFGDYLSIFGIVLDLVIHLQLALQFLNRSLCFWFLSCSALEKPYIIYKHINIYVYIYEYICVCICICVYIYIYTHTHTHTLTLTHIHIYIFI